MLGSNVPIRGGLHTGFQHADTWGCESIQIYITPSRTWNVNLLKDEEAAQFKEAWKTSNVKAIVAHVPYLVNLASSQEELRNKSMSRLITEVKRANKLGVEYLVLHPGSNPDRNIGTQLIINGLKSVLTSLEESEEGLGNAKILLETVAGQGNSIGFRLEELACILEKLSNHNHLGVCLDTCHVFAAGYDIRGYKGFEQFLYEFESVLGLAYLKAVHINDSKVELGSRVDRHSPLGEGHLGLQCFHALVKDSRFDNVPCILEIPDHEKSQTNLKLLKELRDRKELINETLSYYPKQLSLDLS
jgi:deoxyribonuclease-4